MRYLNEPTVALSSKIINMYEKCKQAASAGDAHLLINYEDKFSFENNCKQYLQLSDSIFLAYKEEILNGDCSYEHDKFISYINKINYIYAHIFGSEIANKYALSFEFLKYSGWDEKLTPKNIEILILENSSQTVTFINRENEQVDTIQAGNLYKRVISENGNVIRDNPDNMLHFKKDEVEFAVKESFVFNLLFAYTKIVAGDTEIYNFEDCTICKNEEATNKIQIIEGSNATCYLMSANQRLKWELSVYEVYTILDNINSIRNSPKLLEYEMGGYAIMDIDSYNAKKELDDTFSQLIKELECVSEDYATLSRDAQELENKLESMVRDFS